MLGPMTGVRKILFPYLIDYSSPPPKHERIVVFFGTNFLGPALPIGWNEELIITHTNKMLAYIRTHFSGYRLMYQPHPNETVETEHFDMSGFTIGEKTVAELFLYANAASIEYVFSACSNASASAFSMGMNAAVFLDTLGDGTVPGESIIAYHGYFAGLPDYFFIRSYDQAPKQREPHREALEREGLHEIKKTLDTKNRIWFLCADPALALRAALIIRELRKDNAAIKAGLIQIHHRRWDLLASFGSFVQEFDHSIELPLPRAWYSVRLSKILHAYRAAQSLRTLPIEDGDSVVSFSNLLFEENCILSFYPKTKKFLIIENRWYDFVYEGGHLMLPHSSFHIPWGIRVFNIFVEFPLRLHQTLFDEFTDKTVNIFRYREPLQKIYDAVFVLMPTAVTEKFTPMQKKPMSFWRRLVVSGFGYKKLKRLTLGRMRRSSLIVALSRGAELTNRKNLQLLLDAPALINDPEVVALQKYGALAPQTIVEIGAAYGGSSLLFLRCLQKGAQLTSIDPFIVDSMGAFQATEKICRHKVSQALSDLGLKDKISQWTLLPEYSYNVVRTWKDSIGLLFIDGDHRYEAVKKDFEEWFPFVGNGGYIIFHDSCKPVASDPEVYDHGWSGPSDFVRELQKNARVELVEQVYSLSIFKKKNV